LARTWPNKNCSLWEIELLLTLNTAQAKLSLPSVNTQKFAETHLKVQTYVKAKKLRNVCMVQQF
jgi:hypothetical protein